MEEYVNLERQREFVADSQTHRFEDVNLMDAVAPIRQQSCRKDDEASLERIKKEVMQRVSNYTIDEINMELMHDNKLVLTEEERRYAHQQKLAFLIKKGVPVKQKYENLKKLSEEQREEKNKHEERELELREAGMLGVAKNGKSFVIDCNAYTEGNRLNSRTLNKDTSRIAKNFSDRRGTAPRPKRFVQKRGEHVVRDMMRRKDCK